MDETSFYVRDCPEGHEGYDNHDGHYNPRAPWRTHRIVVIFPPACLIQRPEPVLVQTLYLETARSTNDERMIRSLLGRLMSSFTPLIEAHRFKAVDRQTPTTEGIDDRQ